MHRVSVDTGGTFTDTVLLVDGEVHTVKTPTTSDLITGIMTGIERACADADVSPADIDRFTHGSTVAVNALIEGEGAETALVTTRGFRDVLEIGRGFRRSSLLYDPCGSYELPLIPRRHRYEVTERMGVDGEVETPLSLSEVDDVVAQLPDDVEAVAVCFLHAHKNGEHERQVADHIADLAPALEVSISSAVSPEIREYRRTATTAVDAYLKPTVASYISRLEAECEARGLTAALDIMKSDGGSARSVIAKERPVTQTVSGPVGGVKTAQYLGEQTGLANLITFDMGGTSCDTAIVIDGEPVETAYRDLRGMTINGPFVNIETVGAGGGSIAWIDEVDSLQLGPQSAGSVPGPVCYGRGGEQPTVTDADLVLGLLNPENFAGGEFDLDAAAAERTIRERVAEPLDLTLEEAAVGIKTVIDSNMAGAVRTVSVEEGFDPREFGLVGYGGAGPMHACDVATELGIDTVVFPDNPGLTSAMGCLLSDIKHDYVRSVVTTVDEADHDALNAVIDTLRQEGVSDLDAEEVPPDQRSFAVSMDLRYLGQAHNLNVGHDGDRVDDASLDAIVERFERRHEDRYGFVDERNPVEIVNVRVTTIGHTAIPERRATAAADAPVDAAKRGTRDVVLDETTTTEVPFYDGNAVGPGHELSGPAVVELDNSTVWIPPEFDATVDEYRNIVARRTD
jgi:N-methylhydantoinase A